MAYDEDLANRIRELIGLEPGLTEKKMFGGLAFLIDGHMSISASRGGVLVHVDPQQHEKLVATTKATTAVMRGREMTGWLRVAHEDIKTKAQLAKWVKLGVESARRQPPKR